MEKSEKQASSSYGQGDQEILVAAIKADASSSEEFYWIMKLLSSELPLSNIEKRFARKMDEMQKVLDEMQAVQMRLRWIKPEYFSVPQWTIHVIKSGIWKYRAERLLGEIVQFDGFREFIEAPPPMGMGSSLEKLKEICSGSEEALRMIDEVTGE